jgi:hypothetical protein
MALVVSTKQPFLVVHFRREAAEALKARPKIAQGKGPQGASPWVRARPEMNPAGAT